MSYSKWTSSDFGNNQLLEIIDGDRGKNYPNGEDFQNAGYCIFLNTKNVTKTGFDFTEKMFITKEKDEVLRKGKLIGYDVVMTTRGTVGNIAYFDPNIKYKNVRINSGMVIIRANNLFLQPKFLYYILKNPITQEKIKQFSTGSAQPQLPISTIKKVDFSLPDLATQKAIANILSSLDDKIELNNKINKNLEELAQIIYKRWFVDFEFPNEDGDPYKSSGGEMVESELGMIPLEWKVVELKKVVTNSREKAGDNIYPVLSAVKEGKLVLSSEYFNKNVPSKNLSKYLVVKKDMFSYNPARVNIGSIGLNEFDYMGCVSPVYVVLKVDSDYVRYFAEYFKTRKFKDEVILRASGSVRQTLKYEDFGMIKIVYPKSDIVKYFNQIYNANYKQIKNNNYQNNVLSKIRDEFLPKLMSGEIEVPIES
jgi:type I restriction enzyme S subunit